MKANGIIWAEKMDEEFKSGSMVRFTRVTGKLTRQMVAVGSFTPMEMFIMASGKMIRHTGSDSIIILMAHVTKASGLRISNMAMEKRSGPTMLAMRVNIAMAKNMVMGSSFGPMAAPTRAPSSRTISTETGSTLGQTVVSTMASG